MRHATLVAVPTETSLIVHARHITDCSVMAEMTVIAFPAVALLEVGANVRVDLRDIRLFFVQLAEDFVNNFGVGLCCVFVNTTNLHQGV